MNMIILLILMLFSTAALAQQPAATATAFAPITIDQQTWETFRKALGQLKFDEVLPLIQFWEKLERDAQQKAAVPAPAAKPKED
jgi:hypothetical protein